MLPMSPKCNLEDIIKTNFQEQFWVVYWIDLAHNRGKWRALVKVVINLRVP